MNTLILAAGKGTRLRPYTNDRPKCMVPVAGVPILQRQLAVMKYCGITDGITIIGGYRSDYLKTQGANLVINPEYATTNMVRTLFCAEDQMIDGEDLLISYGDIVFEPYVLQSLLSCDEPVSLAADGEWRRLWQLRMDEPLEDAETFKIDSHGYVIELGKKPTSYDQVQAQYMGLIKVRGDRVKKLKEVFRLMDRSETYDGKDFDNMYMTSFIQYLIDSGWPVKACLVSNGWLEIDTAEELQRYNEMAEKGKLSSYCKL